MLIRDREAALDKQRTQRIDRNRSTQRHHRHRYQQWERNAFEVLLRFLSAN
jgi:hypothetical protein